MRWGKTTWRWVEYQQGTWPSPQNSKQPDLEFSLYGHYLPLPRTCLCIILTFIVMLNTMVVWQNVSCIIIFPLGTQLWWSMMIQNLQLKLLPTLCNSRKYPHSPPQKEFEIWQGGGVVVAGLQRAKMLVNAWSLTGISREVGGLRKNRFRGGGMDNIWNHT